MRVRALWFKEYADTKLGETVAAVFFLRVVGQNVSKQETAIGKAVGRLIDYAIEEKGKEKEFFQLERCHSCYWLEATR